MGVLPPGALAGGAGASGRRREESTRRLKEAMARAAAMDQVGRSLDERGIVLLATPKVYSPVSAGLGFGFGAGIEGDLLSEEQPREHAGEAMPDLPSAVRLDQGNGRRLLFAPGHHAPGHHAPGPQGTTGRLGRRRSMYDGIGTRHASLARAQTMAIRQHQMERRGASGLDESHRYRIDSGASLHGSASGTGSASGSTSSSARPHISRRASTGGSGSWTAASKASKASEASEALVYVSSADSRKQGVTRSNGHATGAAAAGHDDGHSIKPSGQLNSHVRDRDRSPGTGLGIGNESARGVRF